MQHFASQSQSERRLLKAKQVKPRVLEMHLQKSLIHYCLMLLTWAVNHKKHIQKTAWPLSPHPQSAVASGRIRKPPEWAERRRGVRAEQGAVHLTASPFASRWLPRAPCPGVMRRGQPLAATSLFLPELCQLSRAFCIY